MGILLAFAPFIIFAVVEQFVGPTEGLVCGTIAAAALLVRDAVSRGWAVKVLDIGAVVLFGSLATYAIVSGTTWAIMDVRLRVDAGLLLVVLVSIAIRQPFTLSYAREQTPRELWDKPEFVRANYIITAAWAAAFAVMVASDLILLYVPRLPSLVGIAATVIAIVGAIRFTSWYPQHRRAALAGGKR